ncbi:MAG: hypothetical protein ABIH92_05710 [Nanoarchaeota archaeon]
MGSGHAQLIMQEMYRHGYVETIFNTRSDDRAGKGCTHEKP